MSDVAGEWPVREFGRTPWGRGRHVVWGAAGVWPAVAWCGARLSGPAQPDWSTLCGRCEQALIRDERARRAR